MEKLIDPIPRADLKPQKASSAALPERPPLLSPPSLPSLRSRPP